MPSFARPLTVVLNFWRLAVTKKKNKKKRQRFFHRVKKCCFVAGDRALRVRVHPFLSPDRPAPTPIRPPAVHRTPTPIHPSTRWSDKLKSCLNDPPQSFLSIFFASFPPSVLLGWFWAFYHGWMRFLSPQVGGNLESSCSGYDCLVVDRVFHGAEAVADRVLDLSGNENKGGEGESKNDCPFRMQTQVMEGDQQRRRTIIIDCLKDAETT